MPTRSVHRMSSNKTPIVIVYHCNCWTGYSAYMHSVAQNTCMECTTSFNYHVKRQNGKVKKKLDSFKQCGSGDLTISSHLSASSIVRGLPRSHPLYSPHSFLSLSPFLHSSLLSLNYILPFSLFSPVLLCSSASPSSSHSWSPLSSSIAF
jgi:hypothetical protein